MFKKYFQVLLVERIIRALIGVTGLKEPMFDHRKNVDSIQTCVLKTSRAKLETLHGCCYSVLLSLPHFDAPRMCFGCNAQWPNMMKKV